MSDIKLEYIKKFDKLPKLLMTMSYDDDFYQDLMKKAIESGKEITDEDLEKAPPHDLVVEDDKGSFNGFKEPKEK